MPNTTVEIAGGTDKGLHRLNNEDNYVLCHDLRHNNFDIPRGGITASLGDYGCLLVVADGMGGANAGEVASQIAIDTVRELFSPDHICHIAGSSEARERHIKDVISEANARIVDSAAHDETRQGMGTTIVVLWMMEQQVQIGWCGDSRCYVFNRQTGLTQLTKDHSLVQELIDKDELTPQEAHDHPLANIITRSLGQASAQSLAETRTYTVCHGDTFLLCSDGLSSVASEERIIDVLTAPADSLGRTRDMLIDAALDSGGYDNVTVALLRVSLGSGTTPAGRRSRLNDTLADAAPASRRWPGRLGIVAAVATVLLVIAAAVLAVVLMLHAEHII